MVRPPSGRARAWWKIVASLAAVAALVWGAVQAGVQLAHEERTTVTEHPADGITTVDVRVSSGSVTLVGTSSDTVRVTARISDGLRSTGESQTVVGDVLELRGQCPALFSSFCNVDYTVELPADVAVFARTDNDNIVIDGVLGAIDARTDNGRIRVQGTGRQPLRLGTDNGRVIGADLRSTSAEVTSDNGHIELTFLDAPDALGARTDNGSVRIAVPDDGASYRVEAQTDNGTASTSAIRRDPAATRTIDLRSDNGDVIVTYSPN